MASRGDCPKTYFLTGASSGLGAALAPRLCAQGGRIALVARRAEALSAVAEEVRAVGGEPLVLPCDVSDRDAVHRAVAATTEAFGPIDCLVANAGIGDVTGATRFDATRIERLFEVNVFGAVYCIEAIMPSMVERRSGHIVGVSSLAGYRGLPGSAAYTATKAALTTMLESLRIELADHGVDVTVICPGFVKTPLTDKNKFKMPFLLELDDAADRMLKAIHRRARHYAFPWQLASVVRASLVLPPVLYDRTLRGRKAEKSS